MPIPKILAKVCAFFLSLFTEKGEVRGEDPFSTLDPDERGETSEDAPLIPFDPDALGEASEERVFNIITEMTVRNEVPTRKRGTLPYRTARYSALDLDRVDIVVPTKRGDIHVQVKSSKFRRYLFVNDKRNRDIICINGQDSELTITKELRNKLRIAYERMEPARTSDHT